MKKFLLAAPLALAAAGLLATPASAARWNSASQIRAEIAQLDRQVDRARGLSPREEQRLERKVDQLQSLYRSFARNGLNRAEISALNSRIETVRNQLFRQSNDYNGHNGRDWNDRDDRHDDHRDRDHR
jgi:septal ring factor EnvC (AmiA/AmiB activator)